MSIPVDLPSLDDVMARYAFAYLMTRGRARRQDGKVGHQHVDVAGTRGHSGAPTKAGGGRYGVLVVETVLDVESIRAPQDGLLVLDEVGRRTRANLVAQPEVALVWPPTSIAEYSLIVDGRAAVDEDRVWIAPSRAVLHRPAHRSSPAEPGVCASDCLELPLATALSRSRPPST